MNFFKYACMIQMQTGHKVHEGYTKYTKPLYFFTAEYSIKNIYSLCSLWYVVFFVTIAYAQE